MWGLLGVVLSIGFGDSVNPSTVGPALYLTAGPRPVRSVLAFGAGAFAVYTLGGLVLTFGPGHALLAVLHRPTPHTRHLVELGAGTALLVGAAALWRLRGWIATWIRRGAAPAGRASFVGGALIMAFELPTAFPLFAAVAVIVGSGRSTLVEAALVVLFGAAFVSPLVAIAAVRRLAGARGNAWLLAARERLDRLAAVLLPAVVLVLALVLLALGATGLA